MEKKTPVSPNKEIDELLKALLRKLKNDRTGDAVPMETAVKVLNSAMAWEKIKHQIQDAVDPFDPDTL